MFEELIGYQLKEIDDYGFVVAKGKDVKHFEFSTNNGACCGYAKVSGKLLIDEKENPIITKVIRKNDEEAYRGEERILITFFGLDKRIAEISAFAGSDSGWGYGACVSVWCVESDKNETLASW